MLEEIDDNTRAAIIAEHEATKAGPAVVGELPDPYTGRGRDLVADGVEAVAQAAAEQARNRRSFNHGDQAFELRDTLDLRVVLAMQRGNLARALELALVDGGAGVDRLLATDEPLAEDKLGEVLNTWAEELGASPGE